jgi:hypothetical protein
VCRAHYGGADCPHLAPDALRFVADATALSVAQLRGCDAWPVHLLAGSTPCDDISGCNERASQLGMQAEHSRLLYDFAALFRTLLAAGNDGVPLALFYENVVPASTRDRHALRSAFDGLPVLVSRAGSFASIPDLPTPAPFNHVVVAVPAGGAYAWIDPSTPGLPPGRLPGILQGAVGILVSPSGGELINLPEDDAAKNVVDVKLDLTLDSSGNVKGTLRGSLTGVAAARGKEILALPEEQQPAAMRGLLLGDPAGDPAARPGIGFVDVFRVAGSAPRGERDDSLKVQVRLVPIVLGTTNVSPDELIGRALGFLWREGRRSPVFLGARSTWRVRVHLKMPEGMGVAELPVSLEKAGAIVNIEERWAVADGVLSFQRTYTLNERVVPPERYDELRAPVAASWARAQQVVRVVPGGDRGDVCQCRHGRLAVGVVTPSEHWRHRSGGETGRRDRRGHRVSKSKGLAGGAPGVGGKE